MGVPPLALIGIVTGLIGMLGTGQPTGPSTNGRLGVALMLPLMTAGIILLMWVLGRLA